MTCYMGCGLAWVLYNSTSRTFRKSVAISNEIKRPWIPLVALVIGLFLWPLGLIGCAVLEAVKRRKEEKE